MSDDIVLLDQLITVTYVDTSGRIVLIISGDHTPPEGGIEVSPQPIYGDQVWLFPGWSNSPGELRRVEDAWRAVEMPIARENVTSIEFGDDTVPGTAAQWKSYWLALRDWKEGNPKYPDLTKRPQCPS